MRRILGNHVVLAHGDGTFPLYAHLRHRSARVRPGDAVRREPVVAQVGSTGNTSEPHLHVQLMDAASPTAVDGVPANGAVVRTVPVGAREDDVTRS